MDTLRGYINNLEEIGCAPETLIIRELGSKNDINGGLKEYRFSSPYHYSRKDAPYPIYNDEFKNFMVTECHETDENELIVFMVKKTVKEFIREMQHKNKINEVCFCKAGDKFNDLVAFSLNKSSKLPQYNGEFGGWMVSGYDVFSHKFNSSDVGKDSDTLIVYIT